MSSQQDLVSIVVPVYNAGQFLDDTICSVQAQTYKNWELLLVNDRSNDDSVATIKRYMLKDARIKLIEMKTNSGAAMSRNRGIKAATGKYLAFLDADDLWVRTKLAQQVHFMQAHDCAFSFTGYEFADTQGVPNGTQVQVPATISYKQALKNTIIWTSTVMLDMTKLRKSDVRMPLVKSEDTATWWKILKEIDYAYGLNRVLSYYRRSSGTLSSNKFEAVKRVWNLYVQVEKLGVMYSYYNFCGYAFNTVKKRI